MSVKDEYRKERKNLFERIRYQAKRGVEFLKSLVPKIPKKPTRGSIRALQKIDAAYIKKHASTPVEEPIKTPEKPKPAKKRVGEKTKAFQAEYKKEANRIKRYIREQAKKGIVIDYTPPETPDNISPAKLRELKELTPKKLKARYGYAVNAETGEIKETPKPERKGNLSQKLRQAAETPVTDETKRAANLERIEAEAAKRAEKNRQRREREKQLREAAEAVKRQKHEDNALRMLEERRALQAIAANPENYDNFDLRRAYRYYRHIDDAKALKLETELENRFDAKYYVDTETGEIIPPITDRDKFIDLYRRKDALDRAMDAAGKVAKETGIALEPDYLSAMDEQRADIDFQIYMMTGGNPLAGYDDLVTRIREIRNPIERLELLQYFLGNYSAKYPIETKAEWTDRLADELRIRGLERDLKEPGERLQTESTKDYLNRLVREANAKNLKTLETDDLKRHAALQMAMEDETREITVHDMLQFIAENSDVLYDKDGRVNINFSFPKTTGGQVEKFERMTQEQRREWLARHKTDVENIRAMRAKREADMKRYEEHPETMLQFNAVEQIAERLQSLLDENRGTEIELDIQSVVDIWNKTLATHTPEEIDAYLEEYGDDIAMAADEAIDIQELYRLLKEMGYFDKGAASYKDVLKLAKLSRLVNFNQPIPLPKETIGLIQNKHENPLLSIWADRNADAYFNRLNHDLNAARELARKKKIRIDDETLELMDEYKDLEKSYGKKQRKRFFDEYGEGLADAVNGLLRDLREGKPIAERIEQFTEITDKLIDTQFE